MEKKQIIQCEEKLREAMVDSDVEILSELLHDELIFVNHFGQRLTKTADLQAHRSGLLIFTSIEVLEQQVILLASSAVTVTRVSLKGTVGVEPIDDEMWYTRVWIMTMTK